MKKLNRNHLSSRRMTAVSVFLFALIVTAILLSNHIIQLCLKNNETVQENRIKLHLLSQELASASDYLTEEVRMFAVTGDIDHLYKYWHEVYQDKRRNDVIDKLTDYQLPRAERALLAEAKAYSDMLIETEAISMKLVLLSCHISEQDYAENKELTGYIRHVMSYTLPEEYLGMEDEKMRITAVSILYDTHYTETKALIMSPIDSFQNALHKRTDQEAVDALHRQHKATVTLMFCSAAVLILAFLLVVGFNRLYIRPLIGYTETLKHTEDPEKAPLNRVMPEGAYELYRFGKIYNQLILMLERELNRRAEAENNMRSARDEADRANHTKSVFLAQMSHELRTPLHTISGYTDLLRATQLNDRQKQYCQRIEFSSGTLLDLISEILDFSKIEAGGISIEHSSFSLRELLYNTVDMMQSSAIQKQLGLHCEIADDLPDYVVSDPVKLRQVLLNLLGNAIKFTAEGDVKLRAETTDINEKQYTVKISIQDSGIGIRPEDQKKIFEPFVQSNDGISRTYGGTGLGLSISQSVIGALSAGKHKITVQSEFGAGSVFSFCLDLETGEPIAPMAEEQKMQSAKGSRVLLVDDNLINLEMEVCILEQYGVQVVTAQSGEEALICAQNQKFALVFLDLHMPDMDGFEAARRLRLLPDFRTTPIIALTADAITGSEARIKQSDFNSCLTKPFQSQKLCGIITEYLHIASTAPETFVTVSSTIFDESSLLNKLNGNQAKAYHLIEQFLNNHRQDAKYIEIHLENGQKENADRILHNLIGISGNLCCSKLYQHAYAVREKLSENTQSTGGIHLADIWKETEVVLQTFLDNHAEKQKSQHTQNVPFLTLWEKFLSLCRDYDISASDCFTNNRDMFQNALSEGDFRRLEEAVLKYDFPWITKHMKDWEAKL